MRMGRIEASLCKIGAVYLFVTAATSVSWTIHPLLDSDANILSALVGLLLTLAFPIAGGIFLWKYSDRVSDSGNETHLDDDPLRLGKDDLTEVGVVLVGLYAILFGIVSAVNLEILDWSTRIAAEDEPIFSELYQSRNWSRRISYIVQIALGLGLVYGRQGVVALLSKARRMGKGVS